MRRTSLYVGAVFAVQLVALAVLGYTAGGTPDGNRVLLDVLVFIPAVTAIILLLRRLVTVRSRKGSFWPLAMELAAAGAAVTLAVFFPLRAGLGSRSVQMFCLLFLAASPALVAAFYEARNDEERDRPEHGSAR